MRNRNITIKGIFIALVIILFIITLIFCTLNSSRKIANFKKYISELQLIQDKVNDIRNKYKTWEKYNPNEYGNFYSYLQELGFVNANSSPNLYKEEFNELIQSYNNVSNWTSDADSILTNYYYFSPEDIKNVLDIQGVNYHVIINFYTGNIIEKDGIYDTKSKKVIHRQYDSSLGNKLYLVPIYNDEVEAKIEVIENRGLSQKVKIYIDSEDKNKLPDIIDVFYYSENADELRSCSYLNDYVYIQSEKAAYFTVSTSNKYSFIVEDSNFIQYKKVEYEFKLCNPPILEDNMTGIYWDENNNEVEIDSIYDSNWYNYSNTEMKFANAKSDDGKYWVWIPRYSYKINDDGDVDIEFVNNLSNLSTSNKALNGYSVHGAFTEKIETTGFWVSKFQANVNNNNVNIKPGQTLTFNKMDDNIRNYLMTNNQRDSILLFADYNHFEIQNDLVHYAGGSPDEKGFLSNYQYSNTNNIYGVYDLISPENELTAESKINEEGRFRLVIK